VRTFAVVPEVLIAPAEDEDVIVVALIAVDPRVSRGTVSVPPVPVVIARRVPEAGIVVMSAVTVNVERAAVSPFPGTTPPDHVAPADQGPLACAVLVATN
jgi:hypothetical protein